MRRARVDRLAAGSLAGLGAWLLLALAAGPAQAQTERCTVEVNGQPITTSTGGATIAEQTPVPIEVPIDDEVVLTLATDEPPLTFNVGLRFGPFTVPLPAGAPPAPGEYVEPIRQYALFGAGVYNVVGNLDDCQFSAWVNVTGTSPLLTVAGVIGTAMIIIGVASVLSGLLAGLRQGPRRGVWRSVLGGAMVGGGALVVAQQAGFVAIDTTNLVTWTGGPATAAGVAHLALGAMVAPRRARPEIVGDGFPEPWTDAGWDPRLEPAPPPPPPSAPPAAAPPAEPPEAAEPRAEPREAAEPRAERRPPRYAVVELYHGDGEAGAERGAGVAPDEPLRVGRWYAVDISVRSQFSGVPVAGAAPRGVEEVATEETVRITVLAISEDFEIAEPVRTFRLPPQGDSHRATFEVRPTAAATREAPATIRFQLLYRLNLIEDVELLAVVVEADAAAEALAGALLLRYARVQELVGLDALTEKQMRIHVARRGGSFVFYFAVRPEGQDVIFTGRTSPRLAEAELEHLLTRVRLALLAIAVTRSDADAEPLPGASFTSRRDGRQLAQAGEALWTALFRRERRGALSAIGQWLADRPLEEGSIVQVTVDEAAAQFVFPWNLLYDRPLPDDQLAGADLDAFWGMRYVIEQHLPPLKHHAASVIEEPFRGRSLATYDGSRLVASLIVGDFDEAAQQAAYFEQAQTDGLVRLSGGHAIERADEALADFQDGESNLICFFTHGHTALRQGHFGAASLLLAGEAGLPAGTGGERASRWRQTYETIRSTLEGEGESWIMPRHGLIRLARLYTLDVDQLAGSPVVLLNMCESAQVIPSLSGSFVDYFIDRGARAVIGTETSTTPRFAHHFAVRLLSRFLGGVELGPALLQTRRDYLAQGDAFGLVYSLFGAGTVRVAEGPAQRDGNGTSQVED